MTNTFQFAKNRTLIQIIDREQSLATVPTREAEKPPNSASLASKMNESGGDRMVYPLKESVFQNQNFNSSSRAGVKRKT